MAYSPDADSNELSADDLAVLEAFHASDDLEVGNAGSGVSALESPLTTRPLSNPSPVDAEADDMLAIFGMEAEEAIATMQGALSQLEQDDSLDSPAFNTLQRSAHKLKGTAGSIGYDALSMLARHIETVCRAVMSGAVIYTTGLIVLKGALRALELTLESILTDGAESKTPLAELEEDLQALNIDTRASHRGSTKSIGPGLVQGNENASMPQEAMHHVPTASHLSVFGISQDAINRVPTPVSVDAHRLEELVQYAEQLVEQQTPLEHAQKDVEVALEELHAAQMRLRSLEALFSSMPFFLRGSSREQEVSFGNDALPMSSLVARILSEATQRRTNATEDIRGPGSSKSQPVSGLLHLRNLDETALWDELEIARYTENNLLTHSLSEAIADVATASGQLRVALARYTALVEQHVSQIAVMQDGIRMLRSAPLSVLLPRLSRAIQMNANAQQKPVVFEVTGETTEIDSDILEALAHPLLQLVRNCGADSAHLPGHDESGWRIWLYADAVGNEVALEIGFSMTVQGGVLDALREPISRLHGSISAQRNAEGGVSFYLRLPRSRGAVQGLLVRAGDARVVVPFSQVQRIEYGKQQQYEHFYVLRDLLRFPAESARLETVRPVLIPTFNGVVEVDEIFGNVELVMKPLAAHLQRPGIAGAAIDGMGNVLLVLDVPELVKRWEASQSASGEKSGLVRNTTKSPAQPSSPRILIADDSVYIRQSLRQILSRAGYTVMDARDGMEVLEQLLENPPNVVLLDIEMPNLNGYDVLSIIRALPPSPQLAQLKIVMLTSRSSQKHQQRSHELGAHGYLTKPCPQDVMLETIGGLLHK